MTESSHDDDVSPLGDWSTLHPSFGRQVKMLFKKQFIIKFRKMTSIIEFVASIVLVFVNYIIYALAKKNYSGITDPPITQIPRENGTLELGIFLSNSKPTIVGLPDVELVHQLFNHTSNLKTLLGNRRYLLPESMQNLPILDNYYLEPIEINYVNDESEMEDLVYKNDHGAIAVHWMNVNDADCLINPKIRIYTQMSGYVSAPDQFIYQEIRDAIASMNEGTNASQLRNFENDSYYGSQTFSRIGFTSHINVGLAIAFFSALIIILSTMPDFQTVLEEKDNHVAALSFLMGCSETAYWLVSFLTPFLLSLIPYLILVLTLCFWFGMKGTDFFLFLVVTIFFIFSHIWFQLFISTFIKKGSSGRAITVVLLVFELFFSYLHQFFTLSENNSSVACMHVFSIIPFSAYEMFIMGGYSQSINDLVPYTWSTLRYSEYICEPYIPLLWLFIDSVLYLFLFVFFNATLKREFGTPLIRFKDFFKKESWKNFFSRSTSLKIAPDTDKFLQVSGLTKVYHSHKDITALDNIDFHVDTGEVIILIGPNGSGKSTLINTISGTVEPTNGKLRLFDGEETDRFNQIQSYLGVCFQDNVIIDLLSVKEHFELFGAFRGVPQDTLEKCIDFFAKQLQLGHMLDNRAGDLSGGQKRKLCIGLSLLGDPPIVLMDEPTAGVDVQARQLIWKMIASLKHTTSIITSHALEEAEAVSTRLFILASGKIRFCGNSTELRNQYKCGYLLRIEREDGNVEPVLQLVQKYVPEAHILEERQDTITLPVSPKISEFLQEFDKEQQKLGVTSYSLSVEQIEDMLLKLIQTEEAKG